MTKSSKGGVMCFAALDTKNPLRTHPKHVWLSLCPTEINPQQVANSLDTNKAHYGVPKHSPLVMNCRLT